MSNSGELRSPPLDAGIYASHILVDRLTLLAETLHGEWRLDNRVIVIISNNLGAAELALKDVLNDVLGASLVPPSPQ
jgi:hypothetical protein